MKRMMQYRSTGAFIIISLILFLGVAPVDDVLSENRGSLQSRVSDEERRAVWYIGKLSYMNGGEELALRECNKALVEFPDSILIRIRKASLLMRLEREHEAIPILDYLLENHPNIHHSYDLRAETFLIVEKTEEGEHPLLTWLRSKDDVKKHYAVRALRDAYSIQNDSDDSLTNYQQEKLQTELNEYREVLRRNPEDKDTWLKQCETLRQLGQVDLAIESVERLIERYPEHQPAYNVSALLHLHKAPSIGIDHPLVLWVDSDNQHRRIALNNLISDAVARVRSLRQAGSASAK